MEIKDKNFINLSILRGELSGMKERAYD